MILKRIKPTEINKRFKNHIDAFLCCSSFEDRCLTIAKELDHNKIKHSIIFENYNMHQYISNNTLLLQKHIGNSTDIIYIDSSDPILTADNIFSEIHKLRSLGARIFLIDITTFTHESLLMLFKILKQFKKKNEQHWFCYTGAAEYSHNTNTDRIWLSKGCANIRSVLGYPGVLLPNKKTHLIVLVGFEKDRASQLISAYDPDLLSLGYGAPLKSIKQEHQTANKYFHEMLNKMIPTRGAVQSFEFSCEDPIECKGKIMEIISQQNNYNIVIAPMNNKISAIGASLVAWENDKIQLCYLQPIKYNYESYSKPDQRCYLFDL